MIYVFCKLARNFSTGILREENIQNADETNFLINEKNSCCGSKEINRSKFSVLLPTKNQ